MQQITDRQFIDAMELAVKEKGGHTMAPGAYRVHGAAFCIVGYALARIDERLCPRDNQQMADQLLPQLGCSQRVAMAAFAAQHANDMARTWDECLAVFRYGLEIWHEGVDLGAFMNRALMGSRQAQVMESLHKPVISAYAKGGYIDLNEVEFCFTWGGTVAAVHAGPVLIKKDHALTA
jgi:hypothetical protein